MAIDAGIWRANLAGMSPEQRQKQRAFAVDLLAKLPADTKRAREGRAKCELTISLIDEINGASADG